MYGLHMRDGYVQIFFFILTMLGQTPAQLY